MRGHHLKPPRGTHVAIVGTRASCHPMPVLMMSAPDEGRNQLVDMSAPAASRPCEQSEAISTCRLEALCT